MENEIFRAGNYTAKVVRCNTAIVGSGAAGFNAADRLWQLGQRDIVLVTENRVGGTSRNTGSDKQTYYKLTLSGGDPDSVREMPALETQYSPRLVEDTTELQLDTLTMTPLRPSTGSCEIICLATSCVRNILPLVLMPTT